MAIADGLRARIRRELGHEIIEMARKHVAAHGASSLSLRAIARELGMAPSAIYRYYTNRDDLLTALIIDGYAAIGEAAERADNAVSREDYFGRWIAVCRGVREWAITHPHEYSLVYGSPVPGYHAPPGTVEPATRDKVIYGRIVADACRAGALRPGEVVPACLEPISDDARRVRDAVMPGVPEDVVVRALTAWGGLFGMLSLELFGHFSNVIDNRAALFDLSVAALGRMIGLPE